MLGGIAQGRAVGREHDGQVLGLRMGAGQESVGVMVGRRVEHPVGDGVAAEEVLQPHHAGVGDRPDQHRTAGAGLDQPDPAKDQGAHDALA